MLYLLLGISAIIVIALIGMLILTFTLINDVNPKDIVSKHIELNARKTYCGTLLVTVLLEQEFESVSYDFSTYERNKTIGITITLHGKSAEYDKYLNEDGVVPPFILPEQKVYLMKDGSYMWDFRQFM